MLFTGLKKYSLSIEHFGYEISTSRLRNFNLKLLMVSKVNLSNISSRDVADATSGKKMNIEMPSLSFSYGISKTAAFSRSNIPEREWRR